jgi:glutathione peroxidase-family protein
MAKTVFLLACLSTYIIPPGKDVYKLTFKSLDRGTIQMSEFKGKQVMIATFDFSDPDRKFLKSLDSLYASRRSGLEIIAVPVEDFKPGGTTAELKAILRDELNLRFTIAEPGFGKKNKGTNQHILLQWATNKDANTHCDDDIKTDGEIFIINASGNLYAKLNKDILPTGSTMQRILDNLPIKP